MIHRTLLVSMTLLGLVYTAATAQRATPAEGEGQLYIGRLAGGAEAKAAVGALHTRWGVTATPTFAPGPVQAKQAGGIRLADYQTLVLPPGQAGAQALAALRASGAYRYVEPRWIPTPLEAYPTFTPDDSLRGSQYYLDSLRLYQAWALNPGDTNVVIAITEEPIEWDHPDLRANVAFNHADPINGLDDDGDGYTDNYHGWDLGGATFTVPPVPDNNPKYSVPTSNPNYTVHGSYVSGYAAAVPGNRIGVLGAAGQCRFLPIKTTVDNQRGVLYYAIESLAYAADAGAHIINCSWGTKTYIQFLADMVAYAQARGALVVAAAGNSGTAEPFYPAALPGVVSVCVVRQERVLWTGSTYGTTIDVSAPGGFTPTTGPNGIYATPGFGTSFAAPVVSGIAALIKSQFPAYTNRQIGARLRATAQSMDAQNPTRAGLMGKGRVDAYAALTATTPGIELNQFWVSGRDSLFQPTDTLALTVELENLLDPAAALTTTLSCAHPNVEVLAGSYSPGALGTLATATNSATPFQLRLLPGIASNTTVVCTLLVEDGAYTDRLYFEFLVNPSFQTLRNGHLALTLTDDGRLGYADYPANRLGQGLSASSGTVLYEGGLIVSAGATQVLDNLRTGPTARKSDWGSTAPLVLTQPGAYTPYQAQAQFADAPAAARALGLAVRQEVHAYPEAPEDSWVLLRYNLRNTSGANLSGLYAGLLLDPDLGTTSFADSAAYDPVAHAWVAYSRDDSPAEALALIALSHPASSQGFVGDAGTFGFTDAAKWGALSAPASTALTGGDVVAALSAGPLTLASADSLEVAFALVLLPSPDSLAAYAAAARTAYACLVAGATTLPQAPAPVVACDSALLEGTLEGARNYRWASGEATPTRVAYSTGSYSLRRLTAEGCIEYLSYTAAVGQGLVPTSQVLVPTTPLRVGDEVYLRDSTARTQVWHWAMGDGNVYSTPTATHAYASPGDYTITLTLANDTCSTTVTTPLSVDIATALEPPIAAALRLYPNPSHGGVWLHAAGELGRVTVRLVGASSGQLALPPQSVRLQANLPTWLPLAAPPGLYTLQVWNEQLLLEQKIVIH